MANKIWYVVAGVVVVAVGIGIGMWWNASPAPIDYNIQMPNQTPVVGELKIEDIKVGTGAEAKAGDKVAVHYTGTLADGTVFDSSKTRGTPFEFNLGTGEVIQGWDRGVAGMKVGGVRKLVIPPELGYGSRGVGPIPPNSTLTFEVELLTVNGKK